MPTLFKNGKNYSGTSVSLTQAEYDALTETQKNDGTVYFITDSDAVLDASDVALGSGTVETLAGSIATIETSPATANHSVGEYIVYNGQLYKVTTAITAGTTLTGKITSTNVGTTLTNILYGDIETTDIHSDLNDLMTGVGLFSSNVANNPFSEWCLVISAGVGGTRTQVAFQLSNASKAKTRYNAGGTWSAWADIQ